MLLVQAFMLRHIALGNPLDCKASWVASLSCAEQRNAGDVGHWKQRSANKRDVFICQCAFCFLIDRKRNPHNTSSWKNSKKSLYTYDGKLAICFWYENGLYKNKYYLIPIRCSILRERKGDPLLDPLHISLELFMLVLPVIEFWQWWW